MYNEFTDEVFPCDLLSNSTYFCSYPNDSSHPQVRKHLFVKIILFWLNSPYPCQTLLGDQVLSTLEYNGVKTWAWLLVLLGMALFFRIVFYLLLRFANKGKR